MPAAEPRVAPAEQQADHGGLSRVCAASAARSIYLGPGDIDTRLARSPAPRRSHSPYRLGSYLESVASRESRTDVASLRPLLQPHSVAVVGASRHPGAVGRAILSNIVTGGFTCPVTVVDPHAEAMGRLRYVASVDDLPEQADLAVIAEPPSAVPEVAATPLITQEALFDQAGIIATTSIGELADTIALLACQLVVAREDGACCVEVRVRVSPAKPRDPFLRRLFWTCPGGCDAAFSAVAWFPRAGTAHARTMPRRAGAGCACQVR